MPTTLQLASRIFRPFYGPGTHNQFTTSMGFSKVYIFELFSHSNAQTADYKGSSNLQKEVHIRNLLSWKQIESCQSAHVSKSCFCRIFDH